MEKNPKKILLLVIFRPSPCPVIPPHPIASHDPVTGVIHQRAESTKTRRFYVGLGWAFP